MGVKFFFVTTRFRLTVMSSVELISPYFCASVSYSLSVTRVYRFQTVGWIDLIFGVEVRVVTTPLATVTLL